MRRLLSAALLSVAATGACHASPVTSLDRVQATRAQALGNAVSALGADASLAWFNPSAPARLRSPMITLAGQRGYFQDLVGQAIGAVPLGRGVVTAAISSYNSGPVTLVSYDGESRQVVGHRDVLGMVGFSFPWSPRKTFGASVKAIRSTLFEEASAGTTAGDIGMQFQLTRLVKAGVVVQNVGGGLRYDEDLVNLPGAVRAGLAVGWRFQGLTKGDGPGDTVILLADAERPLVEYKSLTWHLGAEYEWRRVLSFRFGTKFGGREELTRHAIGFGVRVRKIRLDYSLKTGGNEFDSPQSISLTVRF